MCAGSGTMRGVRLSVLITICAVALAGCGDDESGSAGGDATGSSGRPATTEREDAPREQRSTPRGTTITLRSSDFGRMLFNARRQAIYVFENDRRNRSNCYGECARDWPPVFTKGAPRAARGVDASLLGTIRRRDGRRQVTYAGRPLYYYANEGPGQVLCHNVDLNGGFWWAVGRDGRRRP